MGQLYRRLEFRYGPFRDELRGIQAECARDGLAMSGALIRRVLRAFADEAKLRTEIVETELRKYRLSCSSNSLVENAEELTSKMISIVRQHIQYIKYESELVLKSLEAVIPQGDLVSKSISNAEYDSKISCCGLIEAVVQEIKMGAETELKAEKAGDRPGYAYYTTIHGPVASVAQGSAQVASVQQQNNTAQTDLEQIIPLLEAARAEWSADNKLLANGAEAAIKAEISSPRPDQALLRAAGVKLFSIASQAGEKIATQALLGYLHSRGWIA